MAALNKIAANSPSRQSPSELESSLANALFDLESNTQDLKASLRPLQFVSAREVGFSSQHELCFSRLCVCQFGVHLEGLQKSHQIGRILRVIVHVKNQSAWSRFRMDTDSTNYIPQRRKCRLGEFSLTHIDLQIEVGHGKKAIAIFVPVPLLQGFHKIQQRYVLRKQQT